MALVSSDDILDFLDNPPSSEEAIISVIHSAVEKWAKNYCRRDLESTTYSKDVYDGTGTRFLTLRNHPVTAVDRVAIGTVQVIKVCNTAEYTTATVSVTSSGLRLVKDGTANTDVTFSSNTTMTAIVNAVNALGNGWSAELISSDYANYKSSELIKLWGRNCIDSNWVDLLIPDTGEDDFELYDNEGVIYLPGGFPLGHNNVFVDYTGGYTTIPDDLQLAIKIWTKHVYQKRDEESFSVSAFKTGDYSASLLDMPKEVQNILARYKRYIV